MIKVFTKQVSAMRRGEAGQAVFLMAVTATAILTLLFATIHITHLGGEKVAAANAVDAIALSAATWEARGLNVIAALNDGILQCLRVIRWTCVVWAGLAVAAFTGYGAPAFAAYTRSAIRLIRSYWRCAQKLHEWSVKVKDAVPLAVIADTTALARTLKVTGVLSPLNPRGSHDGENTLELHLTPGPPMGLVDALGPISTARNYLKKYTKVSKTARSLVSFIDGAVGAILTGNSSRIRMLVPEDDFPKRQNVGFKGFRNAEALPIPLLSRLGFGREKERLLASSRAEPYGGGAAAMTWRSRLIDGGTYEK